MTADPAAVSLGRLDPAPYEAPARRAWRPTRLQLCLLAWATVVGLLLWHWQLTTNTNQLMIIIGTGLIAGGAARKDHVSQVLRDWFPLFVILAAYNALRNEAGLWFTVHYTPQINFDKAAFGTVPTLWLQHAIFTPGSPHIWDYVAFFVYLSHFFVSLIVAAVLWKFAHDKFHRFAVLFVSLSFASFTTYALFPAAPPWLASQSRALPPTAKIVDEIWSHLGLHNGVSLFSARSSLANPVAAVPSLHAALPVLLMLFFWQSAGKWRWLLALYPLAMAFALVYTGEHYVFDIFLGWVYAVVVYFVATWAMDAISRWRAARGAAAEPMLGIVPEPLADTAFSSPD